MLRVLPVFLGLFILALGGEVQAGSVRVAVASNFLSTLQQMKSAFESTSGHQLKISSGSTGKLYTQILNGAPFDVFMAADTQRPELLENAGKASGRITYASGKLVLWSLAAKNKDKDCLKLLTEKQFNRLAIANPKTAPYGAAAEIYLKKHGIWKEVNRKIVRGENIGQTMQYLMSGSADLGLIAMSQSLDPRAPDASCQFTIPDTEYSALKQQAVLVNKSRNRPVAESFMRFLNGSVARSIIKQNGYGVE